MFDLNGKVALITGGAEGIGRSIARELLRNEAKGVALLDTNFEYGTKTCYELAEEFSKDRVIYIKADVTERSQFEDAFEKTIQTFKQLDIVVNNAGIIQEKQWEKCIAVNLQGCITGSLLALDKYFPKVLGSSEGVILNVASVMGLFPGEYSPVYCGTKQGIIQFSRSISGPNRSRGLKVKILTICPGLTLTSTFNTKKYQIEEEFLPLALSIKSTWPIQTPDQLALHVVSLMKNAETGTVWAINDNITTKINYPTVIM